LIKQGKLVGVLYLENNLAPGVFTPSRLATLELIASQAAMDITGLKRAEETQIGIAREREMLMQQ
jgi:GAF domain-containing protein